MLLEFDGLGLLPLGSFKTCPSLRLSFVKPFLARNALMVVPLAKAILLKLSPALTVTVPFLGGVLLEVVVLVLAVVFDWVAFDWTALEPGSFKT